VEEAQVTSQLDFYILDYVKLHEPLLQHLLYLSVENPQHAPSRDIPPIFAESQNLDQEFLSEVHQEKGYLESKVACEGEALNALVALPCHNNQRFHHITQDGLFQPLIHGG
jgi:hypothetical protein